MKKRIFGKASLSLSVLAVSLTVGLWAGQDAAEAAAKAAKAPTAQELKLMSTFLSNFTELGFCDFDVKESGPDDIQHLGGDAGMADLIHFGVRHNYVNNFKTRIKQCSKKNCEHGSLTIDAKFVAESVKKYFDIDLKHRTVEGGTPYYFDGKLYHFEGADGEFVYHARVKEATKEGGVVRMTGYIYDADAEEEEERPDTFEAIAKPHKWEGKDAWAILYMKTVPEVLDMAELLARTKGTWRLGGAKGAAYIVMDGQGAFEAYDASGALEASGRLEPTEEEYGGGYIYNVRDPSGKDLERGFFVDSATKLHFADDIVGEQVDYYIKDKD